MSSKILQTERDKNMIIKKFGSLERESSHGFWGFKLLSNTSPT